MSGNYLSQFSTGGGTSPKGITVDASGNVWTQNWNDTLTKFNSGGTLQTSFNSDACGTSVALDGSGNLWAAETCDPCLLEFNTTGTLLKQIPNAGPPTACTSGSGDGYFAANSPTGVAIDASGNVWTADVGNHRVQKFSSAGAFLLGIGAGYQGVGGAVGTTGTTGGKFNKPYGIAVDASGNVWVTDQLNFRVQQFNSSGTFLQQFPCAAGTCANGTGNGLFSNSGPYAIAIDATGNIWVADAVNDRVQEWNSSGTWLASLGGTAGACASCLCTGPGNCPHAGGNGNGQFNAGGSPQGIFIGTR